MANDHATVDHLRIEIETMLREYPELLEDDELRADMLEGATDARDVLTVLARRLDDAKAMQEGVHGRIEELCAREERFIARGEFLRDLMFKVLETANLKKIELPEVTLSLRSNPPKLVGDADPATVPDELCKFSRSLNRKAIREAIESGHTVEGFLLSNAPPSLVVRVK